MTTWTAPEEAELGLNVGRPRLRYRVVGIPTGGGGGGRSEHGRRPSRGGRRGRGGYRPRGGGGAVAAVLTTASDDPRRLMEGEAGSGGRVRGEGQDSGEAEG